MYGERHLRRKLTVRAEGRQIVLVKKPVERLEHVLMKAFLWALYLPQYDDLAVEIPVGDRYKPDVVSLDAFGQPRFWGEAGLRACGRLKRSTSAPFPTTPMDRSTTRRPGAAPV